LPLPNEQPDATRHACSLLLHGADNLLGMIIKARHGPSLARFLEELNHLRPDRTVVSASAADDVFFGGIDVSATLHAGHVVTQEGVLARASLMVVTSAQLLDAQKAARLVIFLQGMDKAPPIILIDESADDEENIPDILERYCAFRTLLTEQHLLALKIQKPWRPQLIENDRCLPVSQEQLVLATTIPIQFGLDDPRWGLFLLHAARCQASLRGADDVKLDDFEEVASLIIANRANKLPEEQDTAKPEVEDSEPSADSKPQQQEDLSPQDILVDAIKSAMPEIMLANLQQQNMQQSNGKSGRGPAKTGNRRGAPRPPRQANGHKDRGIHLGKTLANAAPWQRSRRAAGITRPHEGPIILPDDLALRRYAQESDRLVIFGVDASGSSAMARLAEVKGAVEQLLGQAYIHRDHVALVSFRGQDADLLLPATRSLVQTKKKLAGMLGGGGTPLATGMAACRQEALRARRQGLTALVVLLTDGRANVARDGSANRDQAKEDASAMARQFRAEGISSMVVDTGRRASTDLKELASMMAGRYQILPNARADQLSQMVGDALRPRSIA